MTIPGEPIKNPYETVALTDLDDGPVESVTFVEAPEDGERS